MNRRTGKAVRRGTSIAERSGIPGSVSAVFVFLAAFLAVASYLGGGTLGLASAGLVAVVVVVGYLLSFGMIARLPVVRRLSEPKRVTESLSAPIPQSRVKPPPTGSRSVHDASRKRPRPRPEPPIPDLAAMLTRGVRNACDSGPHDVESGRPTKIALVVERGLRLLGTLEERDGDDFEWMIVDEDNWVRYMQTSRCDVEGQGLGKGTYKISWKVPSGGPWFLVLEAYGKQLVREVIVNLRLSSGL